MNRRVENFDMNSSRLALVIATALFVIVPASAQEPRQIRILGPDTIQRANRNLVHVEGLYEGKTWKPIAPDKFSVKVTGAGSIVEDPAAKPMNPFEIRGEDVAKGKVTVEIRAGALNATRTFDVGSAKTTGLLEATVSPSLVSHRFTGLGGGVLFYDNQFDITDKDDIIDWCFKDVRTSFLHVLIRSDYEKENDNDDWKVLDLNKFDFKSLERPLRIIKKALERNPDLKIYASLYSPPAWMKTNNKTEGKGSLKDGLRYRQELAEYVFAYLKRLDQEKLTVHYLGFFNEPEFPHTQEGMHIPDFAILAETFYECAKALDTLITADASLSKKRPIYIFPDVLGPGAITRSPENSKKLRERVRYLDKVGVWGVHDYFHTTGAYWNDRYKELRAFPGVGAKPIWMTEWSQGDPKGDLGSAIDYGSHMLNALRLGAETWMVFEWCHPSGNQAGLISTDWSFKAPRERYWRSKSYHIFRQIANTTPPGGQVVSMKGQFKGISQAKGAGVEYLAVRHEGNVIVHLMNTEPAPVGFRVTIPGVKQVEGRLTTPTADFAEVSDLKIAASVVSGVVPGNSLLTLTAQGVAGKKKTP